MRSRADCWIRVTVCSLLLLAGCRESQRSKQGDELLRQQREQRAPRDAAAFTGAVDEDGLPVCEQGALCAEQWFSLYRDAMCACTDRACADEVHAGFMETAESFGSIADMTDEVEARIGEIVVALTRCNLAAGLAAVPDGPDVPRPVVMQRTRRLPPGPPAGPRPTCSTTDQGGTCMQEWAHYYRSTICACPDRACGEPVYAAMKDWLAARGTGDFQTVMQLEGLSACLVDVLSTDPAAPRVKAGPAPTCTEGIECMIEWQAHWMTRVCECAARRSGTCAKGEMERFGAWMKSAPQTIARGGNPSRFLVQQMTDLTSQIGQCSFEAMWLGGIDERRASRGVPTQRVRRTAPGPQASAKPTCTTPGDMATCWNEWFSYYRDRMCACPDRTCADAVEEEQGQFLVHIPRDSTAAPDPEDEARSRSIQEAYRACLDDAANTDPDLRP